MCNHWSFQPLTQLVPQCLRRCFLNHLVWSKSSLCCQSWCLSVLVNLLSTCWLESSRRIKMVAFLLIFSCVSTIPQNALLICDNDALFEWIYYSLRKDSWFLLKVGHLCISWTGEFFFLSELRGSHFEITGSFICLASSTLDLDPFTLVWTELSTVVSTRKGGRGVYVDIFTLTVFTDIYILAWEH